MVHRDTILCNTEHSFTMTLPSTSSARPTICNRPCDVCSIRWSPLLPFLPPCLGSSEKDRDKDVIYLRLFAVCWNIKRKTVGAPYTVIRNLNVWIFINRIHTFQRIFLAKFRYLRILFPQNTWNNILFFILEIC